MGVGSATRPLIGGCRQDAQRMMQIAQAIFVRRDRDMSTPFQPRPRPSTKSRPCQKFESVDHDIIECMFDSPVAATVSERIVAAARAENRAACGYWELDLLRLRQVGERETWCTDTQEAIAAEVGAALTISQAQATSYLYYARTMRTRLSKVGALLRAADISYRMFQTIAYRTDLITDPEVMAAVDARLAA